MENAPTNWIEIMQIDSVSASYDALEKAIESLNSYDKAEIADCLESFVNRVSYHVDFAIAYADREGSVGGAAEAVRKLLRSE